MTPTDMAVLEKKQYTRPHLKQNQNRVTINWTQLNAIINGVSAIDQPSLAIRNRKEAERFAQEYGFDLSSPSDLRHIQEVHREAIDFIEEYFLTEEEAALISRKVRYPERVLDLLVYSSNYLTKSNMRQLWACAVLKVMHGIFHIDHDFKLRYFDLIRDQIFETLDQIIVKEGHRHFLVGIDNVRIPLYHFEKKRNKGRNSVLLKLLQKPKYVAADIYDHLGIRMVFETKAECLFALQQLRKQHLVTVTNIKPFRSRNSLVDLKEAKNIFKKYRPLLVASDDYPRSILRKMDKELDAKVRSNRENPHSSDTYQAIQVTARKMIHLPNPAKEKINELMDLLGDKVPDHLLHDMDMEKELTIYFDYEIQLLDKSSWLATLNGPSSHRAYKSRQRQTARKRVLGNPLVKKLKEKLNQQKAVNMEGV